MATSADLFSLGAILYQLLTGRPPFQADTPMETLRKVIEHDPERPSSLNAKADRDLETICLKCLEKDPQRRYGSAEALAEDLERWLRHEPILARPSTGWERTVKWVRRKPAIAALTGAVVLVALAGATSVLLQWRQTEAARRVAVEKAIESNSRLVQLNVGTGVRLMKEGDFFGSMPWLAEALRLDEGNPTNRLLHEKRLNTLVNLGPKLVQVWPHDLTITSAEFSPDGQRVLVSSVDRTVRVLDLITGESVIPPLQHSNGVRNATFSADGRRIVTASVDRTARVWNATNGNPISPPIVHSNDVLVAVFSPDGQRVLTLCADVTARVWDATTGQPISPLLRHGPWIRSVAFSPDGSRVITASHDNTARVWDAVTGEPKLAPLKHRLWVTQAIFSPDGRLIATGSSDNTAQIWDANTGEPLTPPLTHGDILYRVAFSPDSRRLVTACNDGSVQVWDASSGERIAQTRRSNAPVFRATFSPDGRHIATAGGDGSARVWDAATGAPLTPPLKHPQFVYQAAFSVDGRHLLTYGNDETIRIWNLAGMNPTRLFPATTSLVMHAELSRDGHRVVTMTRNGEVQMWDAATGRAIAQPIRIDAPPISPGPFVTRAFVAALYRYTLNRATFSPDARRILTAGPDLNVRVWDASTGQSVCPPLAHPTNVVLIASNEDASRVITATLDNRARIWDSNTGQALGEPLEHETNLTHVAFSRDGRLALTTSLDKTTKVWDAATGRAIGKALPHADQVFHAAFSPDGKRVATAGVRGVQTWEIATGQRVGSEITGGASSVVFSPDGRQLVVVHSHHEARVWDTATLQPVTPPLPHDIDLLSVAFSADGQSLITASVDNAVRLWDAKTGDPITPLLKFKEVPFDARQLSVFQAVLDPDARSLTVATKDGLVLKWDLALPARPAADWTLQAQLLTGQRLTTSGSLVALKPAETRTAWQTLRSKYPDQFTVSPEATLHWRRRQAEDSLERRQWEAALFHLDVLLEAQPGDPIFQAQQARARLNLAGSVKPIIPPRDSQAGTNLIDLSAFYNGSLERGWQNPTNQANNLASLPRGLQTFAGVQFDVRGVVQLSSPMLRNLGGNFPEQIKGIPVNRTCGRLHFLHGTGWTADPGAAIGSFVIHYANGYELKVPTVYGRDLLGWWRFPNEKAQPADPLPAWTGDNEVAKRVGASLRLYKTTWTNPLADQSIKSIDYVSAMTAAAPFMLAVSAE